MHPLIKNTLCALNNLDHLVDMSWPWNIQYLPYNNCVCVVSERVSVEWINLAQERKERRNLTNKQTNTYSSSTISIQKEGCLSYLSELNLKLDYNPLSNFQLISNQFMMSDLALFLTGLYMAAGDLNTYEGHVVRYEMCKEERV